MKRALLVGINYIGSDHQLNGCIQDVNNINTFIKTHGFDDVKLLTDNTSEKPTVKSIETEMAWLINGSKQGDELFFYYSGHGAQVNMGNNVEEDCIIPSDYTVSGVILEDWIYTNLASKVPKGVTLWAFTDCCHSGTMFDLKYNIQCTPVQKNKNNTFNENDWNPNFTPLNITSKDTIGDIYLFSGCQDSQTSTDLGIGGAFTCCLLEFLNSNALNTKTLQQMLFEINCRLMIKGFAQRSQLSVGLVADLQNKFNL